MEGSYVLHGCNHQRPVYRRDVADSALEVMLYFWREEQKPQWSGWWIGPKVGSDEVWAFRPDQGSDKTPPMTGWRVPFDGPVDEGLRVSCVWGERAYAHRHQGKGQSEASHGPSWENPHRGAPPPPPPAPVDKDVPMVERKALTQVRRALGRLREATPENVEGLREELAKVRAAHFNVAAANATRMALLSEEVEGVLQAAEQRVQDVLEKRAEADNLLQAVHEEVKDLDQKVEQAEESRRILAEGAADAPPEALAQAAEAVLSVLKQTLDDVNAFAQVLRTKQKSIVEHCVAEKAHMDLKNYNITVASRARSLTRLQAEVRATRQQAEAKILQQERNNALKRLVDEATAEANEAEMRVAETELMAKERSGEADKAPEEALKDLGDIASAVAAATERQKATSCSLRAKFKEASQSEAQSSLETQAALGDLMQQVVGGRWALEVMASDVQARRDRAHRRIAAAKKEQDQRALFACYDEDGDGHLCRKEVAHFGRKEYGCELPEETLSSIMPSLEPVTFERLRALRRAVGVARSELRAKAEQERRRREEEEAAAEAAAAEAARPRGGGGGSSSSSAPGPGDARELGSTREAAAKKDLDQQELFAKYDRGRGGSLARSDVAALAREEHGKELCEETLDEIMIHLAPLTSEQLPELQRRIAASKAPQEAPPEAAPAAEAAEPEPEEGPEEAEEEDEDRPPLEASLEQAMELLQVAESSARRAEAAVRPLGRKGGLAEEAASAAETLVQSTKRDLTEAISIIDEVASCLSLKKVVRDPGRSLGTASLTPLRHRGARLQARVDRLDTMVKAVTESVAWAASLALQRQRFAVALALRQCMGSRDATGPQLFLQVKGDGALTSEKLTEFLGSIVHEDSQEKLAKLIKQTANEAGEISEERFGTLLELHCKCVKAAVLSADVLISSDVVRRVEEGELVRAVGAITRDPVARVRRLRCRALADGAEGWASIAGDLGTVYLEPCSAPEEQAEASRTAAAAPGEEQARGGRAADEDPAQDQDVPAAPPQAADASDGAGAAGAAASQEGTAA